MITDPEQTDDEFYQSPFKAFTAFLFTKKEEYLILWNASIERHPYNEMADLIYTQILQKLLSAYPDLSQKQVYCELYAQLFSSNIMTLVRWWLTNTHTVSAEEVQKIMHENMKHGLFYTFRHHIRDCSQ